MWSPAGAPNDPTADVSVDNGNVINSVVSVDGNFTVGRLTIDLGDRVDILDNRTFTVSAAAPFSGAGNIVNNGILSLNSAGNNTILSALTLNGTGILQIGAGNNTLTSSGTLTNGASHTISGGGSVGVNSVGIINLGTIDANLTSVLMNVDPATGVGLSNSGNLQASNGGILQLNGNGNGGFNNTATGMVQALDASEVRLVNGAAISGGILATSGSGVIRTFGGNTAFLDSLTNSGNFLGSDNSTTVISGTINNTGNIRLLTAGNVTSLRIDTAATLTGAGTVTLDRSGGASNSFIRGDGTLTNASTIQGEGNVGATKPGSSTKAAESSRRMSADGL